MKRLLAALGAGLMACAVVGAVSVGAQAQSASPSADAPASNTTALLGHDSVPRIPRNGKFGASACASGSFVVGVRIWLDTFPRVTGFASLCTNRGGAPSVGALVGDTSDAVASGDSVCTGKDIAVGLKAANGEVINAMGVRCAGAAGTYDAAVIGNQTTIKSNADCAGGTAITDIHGWYNIYGGPHINVYGIQGVCDPMDTTPPVVTSKPSTYVSLGAGGFRVSVHDDITGVASVQVTLHPVVGLGGALVRNATCVAGCATNDSQWYVSTAGLTGIFTVTVRATDFAGNTSAPQ